MTHYSSIHQLIERFLQGETTLEEEQQLYAFFAQETIPSDLQAYAPFFRDLATMPQSHDVDAIAPTPTIAAPEAPAQKSLFTRYRRWIAVAAAVLLLVMVGRWGYHQYEERLLAATYDGSYVIVNGERNDNLRQIQDTISHVLAEAQKAEQTVQASSHIEQAEQEVLSNVDDPAQCQLIEEMLNQ